MVPSVHEQMKVHIKNFVCNHTAGFMRHDPDFVKVLYLGVNFQLRYAIPCITLAIVNIRLLLAGDRAHIQQTEIAREARDCVSQFKLPT